MVNFNFLHFTKNVTTLKSKLYGFYFLRKNFFYHTIMSGYKKLNKKTGKNFRLPTEAEWEYAARGGTKTTFHTGNCISTSQANYDGNYPYKSCSKGIYRKKTTVVGSFSPNAYGLYDMSGNVWEWCSDWYDSNYYSNSSKENPKGATSGSYRVLRGGSWNVNAGNCRPANRNDYTPGNSYSFIGFRLVLIP